MQSTQTAKRYVVGVKQLRKSILTGSVQQVYLALNADPALTEPMAELCAQYGVPYSRLQTMNELGSICGIEVGAAAAGVLREV